MWGVHEATAPGATDMGSGELSSGWEIQEDFLQEAAFDLDLSFKDGEDFLFK